MDARRKIVVAGAAIKRVASQRERPFYFRQSIVVIIFVVAQLPRSKQKQGFGHIEFFVDFIERQFDAQVGKLQRVGVAGVIAQQPAFGCAAIMVNENALWLDENVSGQRFNLAVSGEFVASVVRGGRRRENLENNSRRAKRMIAFADETRRRAEDNGVGIIRVAGFFGFDFLFAGVRAARFAAQTIHRVSCQIRTNSCVVEGAARHDIREATNKFVLDFRRIF